MAAAFPFILPSRIWSAEVSPNDRIRMGFIGMGKQNQGLLNHFMRLKDSEAVAVCDVDTNRRKQARERVEKHVGAQQASGNFKGCEDYNDYQDLLARSDIDAVCIATPDHWHALMSVHAAKAKKDSKPKSKKPLKGFMLFSKEMRPKVKAEDPDLTFGGIGKRLGELWRGLSDAEKAKYNK